MQFDSAFFEKHQKRLLQIANSRLLRWILGLDRMPKDVRKWKITKISPNSIHRSIGGSKYEARFFTRPYFAESLAFNVSPLAFFEFSKVRRFSPVGALGMLTIWFFLRRGSDIPWYALPMFGFATTTTFYPNGDLTIYKENSTSWSATHDATDGQGTTTDGYCAARIISSMYGIYRYFAKFDTSSIPDTDTISSAAFALYGVDKPGTPNAQTFNVYDSTAADALTSADYDQAGTTAYSDSPIALTDWSTTGYNIFSFNQTGISGISKTSNTKLSLRQATNDVANTAPTLSGDIRIGFNTSSYAGTDRDPYLSVTYTPLVTSTVTQDNLAMLGVS